MSKELQVVPVLAAKKAMVYCLVPVPVADEEEDAAVVTRSAFDHV
jgi:hypothetical protein